MPAPARNLLPLLIAALLTCMTACEAVPSAEATPSTRLAAELRLGAPERGGTNAQAPAPASAPAPLAAPPPIVADGPHGPVAGPADAASEAAAPAPQPAPIRTAPWSEEALTWQQVIADDWIPPVSTSIGDGVDGRLKAPVELPHEAGPRLAILEPCRERETNFANAALVELLRDTADTVAAADPDGPRLMVCNMSRKRGGNLPWSHSHNSGLDADLAFFVRHKGVPVDAPQLMNFNGDLVHPADDAYTFDVERNWQLVKALVSHPTIRVQWIFVSHRLRKAVLEHAVAAGEPRELLFRAELILWQPTDSSPHKDHFHVRIYCPDSNRAEGCIDTGPIWPWVERDFSFADARARTLSPGLRDPDQAIREKVLDKLTRMNGYAGGAAIAELAIFDPRFELRLKATDVLVGWPESNAATAPAFERFIRAPGGGIAVDDPSFTVEPDYAGVPEGLRIGLGRERDSGALRRAYRLLGQLGNNEAASFLARALRSRRQIAPAPGDEYGDATLEARLAADACRGLTTTEIVPALIEAVGHEDASVRRAAHKALSRVTNHSFGYAWGGAASPEDIARNRERWEAWWAEHNDKTRDALLIEGFRRVPVRVNLEDWDTVDDLIKVTARNDELGYNADRIVAKLSGRWSPPDTRPETRHERWASWWKTAETPMRNKMTTVQATEKQGICSHQKKGCAYSYLGTPNPDTIREEAQERARRQKEKKKREKQGR